MMRPAGGSSGDRFFDNNARTFSYQVTWQGEVDSTLEFEGMMSIDGTGVPLDGDQSVEAFASPAPEPKPGTDAAISQAERDLPDNTKLGDQIIVTIHMTPDSGTSAHALEEHLPEGVEFISADGGGQFDVVSRVLKWGPFFDNQQRTLSYQLTIPGQQTGPLNFEGLISLDGVSQAIGGDLNLVIESSDTPPAGGNQSAERMLPESVQAGSVLDVSISVAPLSTVSVYALEEKVPSGLAVGSITESGQWDPVSGAIKWGPFFDNQQRTLSYQLTIAGQQTGLLNFEGLISLDGVSQAIGGDLTLVINGVHAVPRFLPVQIENRVMTIEWTGDGRLQWAAKPSGPYIDHPDQSNPQSVDVSVSEYRFYRVVAR